MYNLRGQRVLVIGGSSGIGLATALAAAQAGAQVTIAARNASKLAAAQSKIGHSCQTAEVNVDDEASMRQLFGSFDRLDHILLSAGGYPKALIRSAEVAEVRSGLDQRFWGAFFVCKHGADKLRRDGSVTFITGVAAFKPGAPGGSVVASGAGAVDTFARSMAKELAPIRVNSLSPGLCDTDFIRETLGDAWEAASKSWSERAPVGRVGTADEIAHGALFLMTNGYVTGSTLHIEGGIRLV